MFMNTCIGGENYTPFLVYLSLLLVCLTVHAVLLILLFFGNFDYDPELDIVKRLFGISMYTSDAYVWLMWSFNFLWLLLLGAFILWTR
jgi:hypothetical protein